MQQLFSVLPVIGYTFEKNYFTPKENFNIIHLLRRFDIVELLRDRSVEDFYLYVIDDGDTPETVAYKLYGNPYYYYIIMIFNNVYDVYSDWAKSETQMYDFCLAKYGKDKINNIHHWENSKGEIIQKDYYIGSDVNKVTNYEYEIKLNDKKRTIKVISPSLISTIDEKIAKIFSTTTGN